MNLKSFNHITLNISKKMGEAALKKALEIEVPVVFSVVDNGGNLLYLERMDNAFVTSVDISINKAFTAWALKKGTNELSNIVLPGESLYGLNLTNNSRIITFGGGFPIIVGGEIVGAVGVSGGTVEEDMEIAKAALNSL